MSVAFSPDGGVLASASNDKTVRPWRPYTGDVFRTLEGRAALRGDPQACLAVIVPGQGGWAAYTPDGRYKLGGNAPSLLGFTVGLCRFEPGELDDYPDAFDHPPRHVGEGEPLFVRNL